LRFKESTVMALVLWTDKNNQTFKKEVLSILSHFKVDLKVGLFGDTELVSKNDKVIAFGNTSLEALQKEGCIQKNRTLGGMREKIHKYKGCNVLLTWNPGLLQRDYSKQSELFSDLRLAVRYATTGLLEPVTGAYTWVKDYKHTIECILKEFKRTGKKVPVALDLETCGLVPYLHDKWIVSISLTYKEGQAEMIHFTSEKDQPIQALYRKGVVYKHKIINWELAQQLDWILNSDKVSLKGANLKYDLLWMREKWDLDCVNFKFDTLLVGSLLDENRSNSLNTHAKLYTDIGGYDTSFNQHYDKGRMNDIPKKELTVYAGGDTDACWRTAKVFKKKLLENKPLANFYVKLLHPASRVFETLERRGMYVDLKEYKKLRVVVAAHLKETEEKALALLPRKIVAKYKDNLTLTRSVIIKDFMFTKSGLNLKPKIVTEKTQKPSTSLEHLEMFSEHEDAGAFIELLSEYNSAKKTLGTYIDGFTRHIRPDGKFHPSYFLYMSGVGGTVTGRLSAKDPAFQTIPKHTKWAKALRKVYPAPPGHVVLSVDYSQGELKVAACVANETRMIQLYNEGIDAHAVTGAEVFGLSFEDFLKLPKDKQKKIRQGGKAGNFGLLYGMSAGGFQVYARKTYGVDLTLQECEEFRHRFLNELYPKLPQWHDKYHRFAQKNKYIPSPLGRVRHLPMVDSWDRGVRSKQLRQAINSPIQSTLSDLTQFSMVQIAKQYPDLHMFGMCHDAIYAYVKEEEVCKWAKIIIDIMSNLPLKETFNWEPQLQFTAEAEAGKTLADCEEVSLAA